MQKNRTKKKDFGEIVQFWISFFNHKERKEKINN
jgi:hypothetical protein